MTSRVLLVALAAAPALLCPAAIGCSSPAVPADVPGPDAEDGEPPEDAGPGDEGDVPPETPADEADGDSDAEAPAPCETGGSCADRNPCTVDRCDPARPGADPDGCVFDLVIDGTPCVASGLTHGVCSSGSCVENRCGDGLLSPDAGEWCDDGNTDDGDLCRNDCTPAWLERLVRGPGGRFGSVLALAGDLSGDGVPEILVGAPGAAWAGFVGAGRADAIDPTSGLTVLTIPGTESGAEAGAAVAGMGDLDGNTVADVAIGCPGAASAAGRVRVVGGGDGVPVWTAVGDSPGDRLGTALAAIGDVDGDGLTDLATSAPNRSPSGTVILLSGRDGGRILEILPTEGSSFAGALASVPDLDGDGRTDLLAGWSGGSFDGIAGAGRAETFSTATGSALGHVRGDSPGARLGSALSVVFRSPAGPIDIAAGAPGTGLRADGGGPAGAVLVSDGPGPPIRMALDPGASGGSFGRALDGVGDMDGDTISDLAIGSPTEGTLGWQAGSVSVVSGGDGVRLWRVVGVRDGDEFGQALAFLGDFDADGSPEIAVGAPSMDSPDAADAGALAIVRLDF